jgi:hypothetical protein
MFNKFFTFSLSAFIVLIYCSLTFSQDTLFTDNFDSYTAGLGVAENNNVNWDTWSGGGGGGEDCLVSDAFSNSPSNSFVEIPDNDLIYRFGDLTSGMYSISMQVYIPAGNSGYFNLMSGFDGGFFWNTDIFFDAGGTGRVITGEPDVPFSWTEDMWQEVIVIVDLDGDLAEFWLAGAMVSSWPWTSTPSGTSALQLSVNDFFGGESTDQMYVDDYTVVDLLVTAVEDDEVLGPLTFGLEQNYPNPFNPSTKIKYHVSETGSVKLSIYSVLGEEVAVLVDGLVQAGSYEVTFDASNLPSGAYIYTLQTGNTVQAKKMLLMK